jgi:hypothetical protein
MIEIQALKDDGFATDIGLARALNARQVPTPRGNGRWTHTTVARVVARSGA